MNPMSALAKRRLQGRCGRCGERGRGKLPYCEHCGCAADHFDVTPFVTPGGQEPQVPKPFAKPARRTRKRLAVTPARVAAATALLGVGAVMTGVILYLAGTCPSCIEWFRAVAAY